MATSVSPHKEAQRKLATLRQPPPRTMTLRQITPLGLPVTEAPPFNSFLGFQSDGQHALYVDQNAGGLVLADLSGKNKRVIFKNPPNGSIIAAFMPSRDYSIIELRLFDAAREETHAVIKSDGTGYREISKGPRPLCTDSSRLLPTANGSFITTRIRPARKVSFALVQTGGARATQRFSKQQHERLAGHPPQRAEDRRRNA
jgi:hypothetical protein